MKYIHSVGTLKEQKKALIAAVALVFAAATTLTIWGAAEARNGGRSGSAPNKPEKVDVCHVDEYGDIIKINVSENAVPAHEGHGDMTAENAVNKPIESMGLGYFYGENCEVNYFDRYGEITSPEANEVFNVGDEVVLEAKLYNDALFNDNVQWAVRQGTCAANTNTVLGNVDGYSSDYDWIDNRNFNALADTSGWVAGEYCFIFNPTESAGDIPVRVTQNFVLEESGPLVTLGYSNLDEAAGVRYRGNSSGNEIYLGVTDLGVGSNRIEANYPTVYTNWQDGTYDVTFSYDSTENKISTTIDGIGGTKSLSYDFDDRLAPGCSVSGWNTLDINVVDRLTTGSLAFNNVDLNGYTLGDFVMDGWNNWTVSNFDFSQDFTVSGELAVSGWTGSETNKLQLMVGCN